MHERRDWSLETPRSLYEGYQTQHLIGIEKEQEYIDQYFQHSQEAREKWGMPDLYAYGQRPDESLRVFRPSQSEDIQQTVVLFHGGFWRIGGEYDDKNWTDFVANGLLPHGAAVINIDFPVMPSVTMEDLVESVKRAVLCIHRNAKVYGVNGDNLHLVGHSAGGHLAALIRASKIKGVPPDSIKSLLSISGLSDIGFGPNGHLSEGENKIQITEYDVLKYSPAYLHPRGSGANTFLVGDLESSEFQWQTAVINHRWRSTRSNSQAYVWEGADHYSLFGQLNDPASDLTKLVLAQM